eukprot:1159744-Pelagomonas_calceolata.AAC.1
MLPAPPGEPLAVMAIPKRARMHAFLRDVFMRLHIVQASWSTSLLRGRLHFFLAWSAGADDHSICIIKPD